MTISSQICKRIYQADGQTRTWEYDFPILSANQLEVYVTSASGVEEKVTTGYEVNTLEHVLTYPTLASQLPALATGCKITILRVSDLTQNIHLTQQGTLDATQLEGGYDKLTLQIQELAEKTNRCIKYPVSSGKTDADAQEFLEELAASQATALNGALASVEQTKTDLQQALIEEATARQNADNTLQSSMNAKQDLLSTAQQAAVDSGVTSLTVSQVQSNQAALVALDAEMEEKREWQKPADWIDIRSGALPNSVYFLIGHSADYTQFPKLSVRANIANSGSYDIYIDGIKYATTAHNTATDIDWETLALTTGKATTYPISLVTHIVRITPTLSTDTISSVVVRKHSQAASGRAQLGVLWAHYNINNTIEMYTALCTYDSNYQPYLVAITAANDCIKTTGNINGIWNSGSDHTTYCSGYIAHLPTFEGQDATQAVNCARLGPTDTNVKKVVLSGDNKYTIGNYAFTSSQKLKEIVCNNLAISGNARYTFSDNYALKRLPSIDYTAATDMQNFLTNAYSLEPTMLDLSSATGITRLGIFGTSTNRIDGLKGLTVSSSAPFSNTNSPQINVSYTGLDRAALVNLFNSLPTVTDSQVCNITGATGANDLTTEDIAVAVNKGWSVTR